MGNAPAHNLMHHSTQQHAQLERDYSWQVQNLGVIEVFAIHFVGGVISNCGGIGGINKKTSLSPSPLASTSTLAWVL